MNFFKRWFSSSKEQDIDNSQNPWAGLASYEDPETAERKLKFCGRDDDSYDLARLIMGNVFVTLYGKSGIGKTSLLNAGVFPELREEQYTPTSIRLGMRDEEHPQSYQTMIIEAIERVVSKVETINVIDEQSDQHSVDYLWNYFARHRFFNKSQESTIPVVVLDQFEEVYRDNESNVETLLKQMDYLNDKDHAIDSCDIDNKSYRYEQNFRFVISIREDDLYRIEDTIDNCYLPALKRCRYRLRSLTDNDAYKVVLIPGNDIFEENEKDSIAKKIVNASKDIGERNVSTNTLSLLCSRIFVEYKKCGLKRITEEFASRFVKSNPFESFYFEVTNKLSEREKKYIENNFVDSSERRNSISEADFNKHLPNGHYLTEGNTKLFQYLSISSSNTGGRYELIHDSFCRTLVTHKAARIRNITESLSLLISYVLIFTMGYFVIPFACDNKDKWEAVVIFCPILFMFILPVVTLGLIRSCVPIKVAIAGLTVSFLSIVTLLYNASRVNYFIFVLSLSLLFLVFFLYSILVERNILANAYKYSAGMDISLNYSYIDLFTLPANRQWLFITSVTLSVVSVFNFINPAFDINLLFLILSLIIFSWFDTRLARSLYTIAGFIIASLLLEFSIFAIGTTPIVYLLYVLMWYPLWFYVMPTISELTGGEGNWGCGTLFWYVVVFQTYGLIGIFLRWPVLPLLFPMLFIIALFGLYIYKYFDTGKRLSTISMVTFIEFVLCLLLSYSG